VNARYVNDLIERASLDDRTRARMRFFARQILDALSPSNYLATNPQVHRVSRDRACARPLRHGARRLNQIWRLEEENHD